MDKNYNFNYPNYCNLDEDDSPQNSQIPPNLSHPQNSQIPQNSSYPQFNHPTPYYPPNYPFPQNFGSYGIMPNYPHFTFNPPNIPNFPPNPPNMSNFTQNPSHMYGFSTPPSTNKPSRSSRPSQVGSPSSVPETQFEEEESPISVESTEQATNGKSKRLVWKKEEDVCLTNAWYTISDDPITGNCQKEGAFWNHVACYYIENKPDSLPTRPELILRSHWHYIRPIATKFNECYNLISSTYRSGSSSEDVYKMALEKYREEKKAKFALGHVWEIIKDRPAFRSQSDFDDIPTKKSRTSESGASNTSSTQTVSVDFDLNEETRPIGQKAAKRKAKKKAVATHSRDDDNNDLVQNFEGILKSIAELKCMKKIDVELSQAAIEMKRERAKQKKRERRSKLFEIIQRDTSNMTPQQRIFHDMECKEAMEELQSSP